MKLFACDGCINNTRTQPLAISEQCHRQGDVR